MTKKAPLSFAKDHPHHDGQVVVSEEELYADDHEYVKWWPEMFVEHGDTLIVNQSEASRKKAAKVEQATAAPGESRDVEVPGKTRKFGTVT